MSDRPTTMDETRAVTLTLAQGRDLLLYLWDARDSPNHRPGPGFNELLATLQAAFPEVSYSDEVDGNTATVEPSAMTDLTRILFIVTVVAVGLSYLHYFGGAM